MASSGDHGSDRLHAFTRKLVADTSKPVFNVGSFSTNPVNTTVVASARPAQRPHRHDLMEHYVPMAHLTRVMRRVLPGHAQISDQAKEMIQAGVFEFVSLLTSGANQRRRDDRRLTITGKDVVASLVKHGFDEYIEPFNLYLSRYRQKANERKGHVPSGAPVTRGLPPRPPRPPRHPRQTVTVGKEDMKDAGGAATVTGNDSEEGATSSKNPTGNK